MASARGLCLSIVVLGLLVGCVSDSAGRKNGKGQTVSGVAGYYPDYTPTQLAQASEIVVRGFVRADGIRTFASNGGIPESARSDEAYATGKYHDATFEASSYLRGSGPVQLSIRRLAAGSDNPSVGVGFGDSQPRPKVGKEYVLFLYAGADLWIGGHLVRGGDQGIWEVQGDTAYCQCGKSMPLTSLLAEIAAA